MKIVKTTSPPGCALDLNTLAEQCRKPVLFEPSPEVFWKDPYIAGQLLAAHLDPEVDRASRAPATIKKTARWIASVAENKGELLDLGCGPGLYCSEFFQLGFKVTGMDFSASSIAYADRESEKLNYDIEYICQDYLTIEYEGCFEVITLIFGDFCVLSNESRQLLLSKIYRALKPGGCFIFDVTTPFLAKSPARSWQVSPGKSFWHPDPHLVLEEYVEYVEEDVFLNMYHVITEPGLIKTYRVWNRNYTSERLEKVLIAEKFAIDGFYSDLAGSPLKAKSDWMGVVARKR